MAPPRLRRSQIKCLQATDNRSSENIDYQFQCKNNIPFRQFLDGFWIEKQFNSDIDVTDWSRWLWAKFSFNICKVVEQWIIEQRRPNTSNSSSRGFYWHATPIYHNGKKSTTTTTKPTTTSTLAATAAAASPPLAAATTITKFVIHVWILIERVNIKSGNLDIDLIYLKFAKFKKKHKHESGSNLRVCF